MQQQQPQQDAHGVHVLRAGIDARSRPMTAAEKVTLQDSFIELISSQQPPLSLQAIYEVLKTDTTRSVDSYLVGDGSRIPYDADHDLRRNLRLVVVATQSSEFPIGLVMVVGDAIGRKDEQQTFLQALAWDVTKNEFNFYARKGAADDTADGRPIWLYSGSSEDAFGSETRGKGPFSGHVGGGLVMKELKSPWPHWHSTQASIDEDVLPPGDPLLSEPIWGGRKHADELERSVVRPGVTKWTEARLRRLLDARDNITVEQVRYLLQHIVTTPTINITSSPQLSLQDESAAEDIQLPESFFLNSDLLSDLLDSRQKEVQEDLGSLVLPSVGAKVKYATYLEALVAINSRVESEQHEPVDSLGRDTYFAFMVPEPALEDNEVVRQLVSQDALTPRLALAMVMVDFVNPIYSETRALLMDLVPADQPLPSEFHLRQLDDLILGRANAILADTGRSDGLRAAVRKMMEFYQGDIGVVIGNVRSYTDAVRRKVEDGDFVPYLRLAESRRRVFKRTALSEFALTLPVTDVPDSDLPLTMLEDGTLEKNGELKARHQCTEGRVCSVSL